jgi:hypothetical protein
MIMRCDAIERFETMHEWWDCKALSIEYTTTSLAAKNKRLMKLLLFQLCFLCFFYCTLGNDGAMVLTQSCTSDGLERIIEQFLIASYSFPHTIFLPLTGLG